MVRGSGVWGPTFPGLVEETELALKMTTQESWTLLGQTVHLSELQFSPLRRRNTYLMGVSHGFNAICQALNTRLGSP